MNMANELLSTEIFRASIKFGVGGVKNLARYVREFDAAKLLIVTDKMSCLRISP